MRIEDAVARYIGLKARDRAIKPNTLNFYRVDLQEALEFLLEAGVRDTRELTSSHLDQFLKHLTQLDRGAGRARGRGAETIARRFRTLRRFCEWLVQHKELKESPFASGWKIPLPARRSRTKTRYKDLVITPEMVSAAASSTRERPRGYPKSWIPVVNLRDAAILDVLRVTGATVEAVAQMEISDLDFDDKAITVGEYRYPLPRDTAERIQRYLEASAPYRAGTTVWASMANTKTLGNPLQARGIRFVIQEARRAASA